MEQIQNVLVLLVSSLSESHSVVAQIKLSVVGANEHVPKDPDGSHGRGDVHAHEAGQTDLLPHLGDLHHVVIRLQGEIHSTNSEGDVRQVGERSTILKQWTIDIISRLPLSVVISLFCQDWAI